MFGLFGYPVAASLRFLQEREVGGLVLVLGYRPLPAIKLREPLPSHLVNKLPI